MYNDKGLIGMALGSWIVGAAIGAVATVLLWVLGSWGFMQGVFMGGVIAVVMGLLISWIMTRPLPAPGEIAAQMSAADTAAPEAGETPASAAPETPKPAAVPTPVASAPVAAEAAKPAPKKAAPKKAAAQKAAPQPAADGRPAGLSDGARAGGADDLKLIGGVGPKLEETLNSLGIWHFDQVAGLKKEDIAWVDERLRFKGRIERDDWIGQAKTLAAGGDTEFSKKKRKS
ncbi:hypothetical protein ROLI_012310 [Roseobacter fucihabitans]|uniref:Uncharacterized protein n=1 Tax=Roseobacter fucihabitans TaxID=1537242 RepID=A0ABZ2BQE7_9RHOB|nr:hypothetical protein [Roseobacter litoralis]MBC6964241.1 NADH dehydrogenase subunit E [Roseobacter litoralis]